MTATTLVLAVLLGLGLSASTGLNTFLPLLLFSAAARFHVAGVGMNAKFAWLTTDTALIVLVIACIAEIIADKFPSVDHALDVFGTFARPIAGTVAFSSALTHVDPMVATFAGIIVGAPAAFGLHTLKSGTRVGSTATTFGCANPVLSIVEDVASFLLSAAAIFVPLLVPLLLLAIVLFFWRLLRWVFGRRATSAPASSGSGS